MFTEFFSNPNYLYRENALFGIKGIAPYLDKDALPKIVDQIMSLAKSEKVPNVQVLILQAMNELQATSDDPKLNSAAKELYSAWKNDSDTDVSFYAKKFADK